MKLETAARKYYNSKQNKSDQDRFLKFLYREQSRETDKKRLKIINSTIRHILIARGEAKRTFRMKLNFVFLFLVALKNTIIGK